MAKWSRRTYMIGGIVCAAAVACVGIGAGAWTVGNQTVLSADVDGITVDVDQASGLFIDIVDAVVTDGTLKFGSVEDNQGWVTSDETTEDLTIGFKFTMDIPDGAVIGEGITIAVTPTISESLISAVNGGYITLPIQNGVAFNCVVFDENSQPKVVEDYADEDGSIYVTLDNLTVNVTITAGWGSLFGGLNPTKDQEYIGISGALDNMNDIYNAIFYLQNLQDASISFTIGAGSIGTN